MKKRILTAVVISLLVFSTIGLSQQQNKSGNVNNNFPNSNNENIIWDVQLAIDLANGFGAEFDGTFFYVTNNFSSLIDKYDTSGNLIETFSIPGVSNLGDLAYDGVYMYGGSGSQIIFQMDFTTHSLVGIITTPFNVRHIAYDENYDAFWIGSWSSPLALISRTGTVLNIFNILLPTITGTAYDNVSPGGPYLCFFDRGDTIPGPQLINQFHILSGTFTGVTHDVLSDVGIGQPDAIAGGLFSTSNLVQGTFSLGGILVGSPTILFAYEILNPIPVELISFQADSYNGKVILTWETISELNNKGFEIQRKQKSLTGDFEAIVFVSGNGTTTQPHSYQYYDEVTISDIYVYRLKQIDYDGTFAYSNTIEVEIVSPNEFVLFQNYPNPFNPTTTLSFVIGHSSLVTLKVYDVLGNEIATLVNEELSAGEYEIEFNSVGTSRDLSLSSGIYFYQLKAGEFIQTKKMLLLR